jgi:hypothetical protein
MVRIFPRAADQAKKTTLKEVLIHQILFQGEGEPSLRTSTL